jgi:hypothetical protein
MTAPLPDSAGVKIFAFNITPEFCAALAEFQSDPPKIDKNRLVEVETKDPDADDYDYSYATLDHVSQIVLPRLAEHGLSFSAYPGTGNGGGLAVRYFLMHSSGGYIGTEWPISSEAKGMRRVQNLGGLITYIRRYALQAASGTAAEMDDDDLRNAVKAEQEAGATPTAQRRQRSQAARTEQAAANTARRRAVTGERPASAAPAEPDEYGPPRNPDAPISQPQQTKLIMLFGELRVRNQEGRLEEVSRERRLSMIGQLVRPVDTMKALTMGEAHDLIGVIQAALNTDDPIASLRSTAAERAHSHAEPTEGA